MHIALGRHDQHDHSCINTMKKSPSVEVNIAVANIVRIHLVFVKPDGSSAYSQEPTTGICPVPNEQSTYASLVAVRSILIYVSIYI